MGSTDCECDSSAGWAPQKNVNHRREADTEASFSLVSHNAQSNVPTKRVSCSSWNENSIKQVSGALENCNVDGKFDETRFGLKRPNLTAKAAMLGEANALVDLVHKAATVVQYIKSGWYNVTEEVNGFPSKVKTLKDKEAEMRDVLRRNGMSQDKFIQPKLERARELLNKQELEVTRLRKNYCGLKLWRKLVFPGDLTRAIEDVTVAIQNIPQSMQEMNEMQIACQNYILTQVSDLTFKEDKKYVPLVETMKAVREALESSGQVVTLYGGPGSGKTSLAQYLALLYTNGLDTESPAPTRKLDTFDDGVFFLRCERKANSTELLFELWQQLGFQSLYPVAQDGEDEKDFSRKSPLSLALRKQLFVKMLKPRNMLIVIDDVWHSALVEDLLINVKGIKYLLTTQIKGVWPDAHYVQIKTPTFEEAHQILANYVKGFSGEVPEHLEDEVKEIIQKCKSCPLTLANVAGTINQDKSSEIGEWKVANRNVRQLRDGDPRCGPVLYGRSYSKKTMHNAIATAIDAFRDETRTLLCIASIFDQQAVPETVFRLFFKSVHSSLATFAGCSADLEGSSFIQIESSRGPPPSSNVPENIWTIHGERQSVIRDKEATKVNSIISKILEPQGDSITEEEELLQALLVLYCGELAQDRAATRLGITIDKNRSYSIRRCIEGFVFFLCADCEEVENQLHLSARKVILQYVKHNELDDEAMSQLLLTPPAESAACSALTAMACLVDKPLLTTQHWRTVQALLELQSARHDSNTTYPATWAFGRLIYGLVCREPHLDSIMMVLKQTDTLPTLLQLLNQDVKEEVQSNVAWILGSLAESNDTRALIGEFPHLVDALLRLIEEGATTTIQKWALYTLTRLALKKSIATGIASNSCALHTIVCFLGKDVDPSLQDQAARALVNIANDLPDNRLRVGTCPHVLERLVGLLSNDQSPNVQERAVQALANITTNVLHINETVLVSCPGALHGLLELLSTGVKPAIQMKSAVALRNILKCVPDNQRRVVSYPGGVDKLVALLGKNVDRTVQRYAAEALSYICENEEMGMMIRADPHMISHMVSQFAQFLEDGTDHQAQYWVALSFSLIDYIKADKLRLRSGEAHAGRGMGKSMRGMHKPALADINKGFELDIPNDRDFLLGKRCFFRAMVQDYTGAMNDGDMFIQLSPKRPFRFQERGVVKRLMNNLEGALSDLNECFQLGPDDYERLKQRGYVKFLLGDYNGARADGELATKLKYTCAKLPGNSFACLGCMPVKYLEFYL